MPAEHVSRILKVGLIQDGKLIENTTMGEHLPVFIGLDPENVFTLAEPTIPRRHQLISHSHHGYQLHLLPEMKARFYLGRQVVTLEELLRGNKATKTAKGVDIPLTETSKGRIDIGGSTVLFQFVPPPTAPKIIKLPPELRRSFLRNFDYFFITILFITAMLHAGLVYYIEEVLQPIEESAEAELEIMEMVSVTEEDLIAPEEEVTDESTEEDGAGDGQKKGGGGGGGGGGGPKQVGDMGVLAVIGKAGNNSSVGELLSGSSDLGEASLAFGNVKGVRIGTADDRGRVGGGNMRGGGDEGPGTGTGKGIGEVDSVGKKGTADTGAYAQKKVKSTIGASGSASGKIDKNAVRSAIMARLGGPKSCYERALNTNPSLAGKVKVSFIIGASGGVAGCNVVQNTVGDSMVGACVCSKIQRIPFPKPEEGTVTVSYTFVFQPAN